MARKTGETRTTLELDGLSVPVRIITERGRRSTIASVRQRALYIRLPHGLSASSRDRRIAEMTEWARRTAREKPEAFRHFAVPPAADAYRFDFRGTSYRIEVRTDDRSVHRIERTGEACLRVLLSSRVSRPNPTQVIPKLLAKYYAGQCLPLIAERVRQLNDQHFRRTVRRVRLSDTYTRWGSCSHVGNINLATRLLLAPTAVLDAVIIHELAHLVEQNHSPRFWAEVARALPEYRVYDEWLKEHGPALRFHPVAIR
ncbi:M48 family metallopeptidase [Lewinella sp. JB7]|uniref:M48 family metallopeptidase n=1 Tax=Lewinella sp. JB7 TaxID=2962887 RepID=UPI0020C9D474|nr:SprT family zinc-dependent metalloprotease [Lewinella sp. JB7]MCP9234589.1 M48 family metallopeptidase [Lewinella sp. JB7]